MRYVQVTRALRAEFAEKVVYRLAKWLFCAKLLHKTYVRKNQNNIVVLSWSNRLSACVRTQEFQPNHVAFEGAQFLFILISVRGKLETPHRHVAR